MVAQLVLCKLTTKVEETIPEFEGHKLEIIPPEQLKDHPESQQRKKVGQFKGGKVWFCDALLFQGLSKSHLSLYIPVS